MATRATIIRATTSKFGNDKGCLLVRNLPCFNVGDYIDILITARVKLLHMNFHYLSMFQSHPRSLKQVFRTGGNINE